MKICEFEIERIWEGTLCGISREIIGGIVIEIVWRILRIAIEICPDN